MFLVIFSGIRKSEILRQGWCHSGRFCLVGTNSPHRIPLERKERKSSLCQSGSVSNTNTAVSDDFTTVVFDDFANTAVSADFTMTLLSLESSQRFLLISRTADRPWITPLPLKMLEEFIWASFTNSWMRNRQIGLLRLVNHEIRLITDNFWFRPSHLGGQWWAGRRTRAASVCILQAEGRSSADAPTPPHGNESYSHPVYSYKIKAERCVSLSQLSITAHT